MALRLAHDRRPALDARASAPSTTSTRCHGDRRSCRCSATGVRVGERRRRLPPRPAHQPSSGRRRSTRSIRRPTTTHRVRTPSGWRRASSTSARRAHPSRCGARHEASEMSRRSVWAIQPPSSPVSGEERGLVAAGGRRPPSRAHRGGRRARHAPSPAVLADRARADADARPARREGNVRGLHGLPVSVKVPRPGRQAHHLGLTAWRQAGDARRRLRHALARGQARRSSGAPTSRNDALRRAATRSSVRRPTPSACAHTPGSGSSRRDAAAVAAGMSPLGIGTDIGGGLARQPTSRACAINRRSTACRRAAGAPCSKGQEGDPQRAEAR